MAKLKDSLKTKVKKKDVPGFFYAKVSAAIKNGLQFVCRLDVYLHVWHSWMVWGATCWGQTDGNIKLMLHWSLIKMCSLIFFDQCLFPNTTVYVCISFGGEGLIALYSEHDKIQPYQCALLLGLYSMFRGKCEYRYTAHSSNKNTLMLCRYNVQSAQNC